ncbi:MAG: zinc ribbon domain-containing protein [Anaerolineales bacterium]|nr:zinc ribbon domain-containing protein [Anaerolineales bacterium]MBS3752980.1 zinc ribbon domain-containing protein [Anaerolineales bacterium]
MDVGSILVLLSIMLLVAVFVSQPFFDQEADVLEGERELSRLKAERERLYKRIEELDFDYELGKIAPNDLQRARQTLIKKAALIVKKIDELEEKQQIDRRPLSGEAIQKSPPRTEVDEIETLIASRRRELGSKKHKFCPHCGHVVGSSDQYCVQCGERLAS